MEATRNGNVTHACVLDGHEVEVDGYPEEVFVHFGPMMLALSRQAALELGKALLGSVYAFGEPAQEEA